jgi:GNAT superfamily N-acetyltransferase
MPGLEIVVRPVTAERWADVERLFGKNGACGGCWCQWWHQTPTEYTALHGEGNRLLLKQSVESGAEPGLLAYVGEQPVGWCAVGPRHSYSRLARTRILQPVDDQPVWSVVCFFVARPFRRQGVTRALLAAAVGYAREHGAVILEGYPVEPANGKTPDVYAYPGMASTFRSVGFVEVARRSPTRPIMRYVL